MTWQQMASDKDTESTVAEKPPSLFTPGILIFSRGSSTKAYCLCNSDTSSPADSTDGVSL